MSDLIYLILGTGSMVLMMTAIILFVYVYQRKLAVKAKAYQEIEKLMQKQEVQSVYSLIEGQEQERKRIAAELHDNVGGLLATLKMYSDLTMAKDDFNEVKRLNRKINLLTENLGEEVRKLSHKLDLRTLSSFGLKVAVQQLCEAIVESGKINVVTVIDLASPIAENISLQLYRIIQELFTNTLKHAMATEVRLEITLIDKEITLIYEDNGKGFEINSEGSTGMGISNIHSRVSYIHGKLTFDSNSKGTTYILELCNS
ncbi:sensor histidine kinase [Pedobacter punctiformis]|uniref:histidine kinase n=1 Tax=Pedobacter punctiformis TaxID=3004097 RepID=A0ABT4LB09_9SPHI|nr:ATP-binding protein [Pedobacter sp. HCMS5-2]MCZ4245109.1 histidine kinase [Pedobacter sp. HCMS5-2]